jgi:hypothetical protein
MLSILYPSSQHSRRVHPNTHHFTSGGSRFRWVRNLRPEWLRFWFVNSSGKMGRLLTKANTCIGRWLSATRVLIQQSLHWEGNLTHISKGRRAIFVRIIWKKKKGR